MSEINNKNMSYIKYQVLKAERKSTSTGKDKIDADLQDFNGLVEERVTIWSDFPNFASIKVGSEVCGQITTKANGQYVNKTLYPERTEGWGGGKKQPSVNLKKQDEFIKAAQERKNDSIAYFNAINSAIALLEGVTLIQSPEISLDQARKNFIVYYRDWFLSEWDKYNSDPTKGKPPFQ